MTRVSRDTWFLVLGTGNLFATKWVHIKHYGLKIGVPSFWWDSASFLNSTNPEITKMGFKIPGTCYSGKKKAPARKPTNSRPEWGSTPRWSIHQNPIQVLVKKWLFQKSITPKMPKSKASLNNPFLGLLDFGEGLLRSSTAPKSLTALPIP